MTGCTEAWNSHGTRRKREFSPLLEQRSLCGNVAFPDDDAEGGRDLSADLAAYHTGGFLGSSRPDEPADRWHLTLLAETPQGYANLSRLLTEAHRTSPRNTPSLPLDTLLERTEGLVLLTGCRRSPLHQALEDSTATGDGFAKRLAQAFGPQNVFVELQNNQVRGDQYRVRRLARLADRLRLPVMATGNVHYHRPERHLLQDVLTAIRHRSTLDGSHVRRRPNAEFYLASPSEMASRFASRPDALANTLHVAERCAAFDLNEDLGYVFPDFEGNEQGTAIKVLAAVTRAALEERYPEDPYAAFPDLSPAEVGGIGALARKARKRKAEAERRLEEEIRLVERHGLGGFFLAYRDIMELAREVAARIRGAAPRARSGLPPGRGRGSSVSSIICYLIGLSHVDPVEADLFLGRFLNDAVGSVPDIDLDFPRDIREELILAVYEKYGHDHAGLVAIFPTYRLCSAVRKVGKALDLPPGDLEKVSKLAEHRSATGLREDLSRFPEFKEKLNSRQWSLFLERVEEIGGLPRHISQHVGGMIISSRPLVELVPLEPAAMDGRFLCQWDKDSCDDAGFIKIDFLALGMLSLVEEAVDLIAERGGKLDLSRIDLKDPEVYQRTQGGDTVGLFQVESRAQTQMLRRTLPSDIKELAVQVVIVRPGPIVGGGAVNPYVRRREAQRADPEYQIPYDHPLLENALEETLGIIIYQDQVLQVCRDLAGFTDGQAESLRRAMSRKRSKDAMRSHWEAFLKGTRARGIDDETAKEVFRQVVGFSEFGFPKSHASAFALLAYQSAWLRHYFPTEYYVALFNNQPMGFYSFDALGRDARRNGIRIRLPGVNRSEITCTAEGSDLRVGLGFIRGWGTDIAAQVVEERERRGPYNSLVDFLRRTPAALKRPAVENFIWVGGLDELGLTRRELLWQTGLWLGPDEERGRAQGRSDDPQLSVVLGDLDANRSFPDLDDQNRVVAEYRMLRLSTELHPLSLVRDQLPPSAIPSNRLPELSEGSTVTLAGIVIARQRPRTTKGYVFVLIEDEYGHINVIVKPKIYDRCRAAVRMEPFLVVRGKLRKDGATLNVIAREIRALRRDRAGGSETPLPSTMEYWPERGKGRSAPEDADPFAYLSSLRENPPGVKNFG